MEMDPAGVDIRRKKIEDLVAFNKEASIWLETTIKSLEWTKESILQKPSLAVCPIDSNHYVPQSVLSEHTKYCEWVKKGYNREEITKALEESNHFPYENSNVVTPVYIGEKTYQHVLEKTSGHNFGGGGMLKREMPLTIEREMTELSKEERLALYNYVVNTAKEMNKKVSISQDELMLFESGKQKGEGQTKTHLELLAAERDLKRRRQSYKGKSVHTSKKSHTEVIRELIANQMELLDGSPKDDTDTKEESAEKIIQMDRKSIHKDKEKEQDGYSKSDRYSKSSYENRYKKKSEEKDEFDGHDKTIKIEREADTNMEYDRPIKKEKYSHQDFKDSSSKRHRDSRSRSRSRESHRHKHKKKKKSKKHKSSKERSSKRDVYSDESNH